MCVYSVVSGSETPWTIALQAPLSMGFSRQEYWSGLSFPSQVDWLLNEIISLLVELEDQVSCDLQVRLTQEWNVRSQWIRVREKK